MRGLAAALREAFKLPSPATAQDDLTEETLGVFLDAFYAEIRRDPMLAPIFAQRISEPDWLAHFATIRDIWSSVLFRTGRYKGNPFAKHLSLAGIRTGHFERWLGLVDQTAEEMFTAPIADDLSERAHRIGDSLKAGLFFRTEGQPLAPVKDRR